ncbi:MAG: PKD domain-containing protein [Bacteroides sp.]|nr:PKD domain-containing protein [Bacteroides sp.]
MTNKLTLCLLACCAIATTARSQGIPYDEEKLPGYVEPMKAYAPEPSLMRFVPMQGEAPSRRMARQAAFSALPDHWNNAETRYFPPIFNQDGGSCTYACRSGYIFTHEQNSLRDLDGSLPENQYPSHWVWLLLNGGCNWQKGEILQFVGSPNVVDYGGRTFSSFFGSQEPNQDDFGWMNGYDRWKNAIGNRMLAPTSTPMTLETEEGRMAAKAWLYNHAGDLDFKAGGLIAIDVASGGQWHSIPKTAANDAIGVTGQSFVYRWGTAVDHSVTIVGYDDRIEFDLDGNGIAGEVSKDERGAWIIANSWGEWWCNKGFIYCPYKHAGPVSDQETGALPSGYLGGTLFHARKNFRPLRALKLKMDYSHRSELLLQVGISTDLDATEPESVTDMHHFRYSGDGANGATDPAPATPMLGRWQGQLNREPMELMYDLTDFSARFDQNKPLKYFFIINRKNDTSLGSGSVYEAGIVDMDRDLEGIESTFDLGGEKFDITEEGKRLMLSTIVYGKGYNSVNNLVLSDCTLSWTAPNTGSYQVASYNVYEDGVLVGNTKEMTHTVGGGQVYSVSAVYEDGTESAKVSTVAAAVQNSVSANIEDGGFIIPGVFDAHYTDCTIEFFIKPSRFANWNNQAGPGWGTYLQHFNSNGTFTCGWSNSDRLTSSESLSLNTWQHIAIVVKGNKMTLYKNAKSVGTVTSSSYSGLGGFGDYVFRYSGSGEWQNAQYDEIRIWDHARTVQQIRGSSLSLFKKQEFYGDVLPQGLLAYYKGDTFHGPDGTYYLRECVGGHHAPVYRMSSDPQVESNLNPVSTTLPASVSVDVPSSVFAGRPVTLTATRGDAINKLWWNIPSCGIEDLHILSPTVTFDESGTYEVCVSGLAYNGKEYSDTILLDVHPSGSLDASFSFNSASIPCGEHLSMHASTFTESCSYEWSLPGASVETVLGAKAGATYEEAGEYTVTLKVTSSDGRVAESSQTIHVTNVVPKADFYVSEPVVMKGSPVTLHSTSRFTPTSYEWVLNGTAQKTTITDGQPVQSWTPQYPGRYDVTLTAGNFLGDDVVTKKRALIVTNAESGSGLNFSQPSAHVSIPNDTDLGSFTIDFWANPSSLSDKCWGIGKDESTLLLNVDSEGVMTLHLRDKVYKSPAGYVEEGVWNHYAVSRSTLGSSGTITFMRNGETVSTVRNATTNKVLSETMPVITLGVDGFPISGSMDEFRLWSGNQSSKMKDLCNQPMDAPGSYTGLLVYYDFNQSGGDVIDRSGNGRDGVRFGFGPDGDAWGRSNGVFSLYFGDKLADDVITGVDGVLSSEPVSAGRSGVYTLSGQYVGRTVNGLPSGLYIVDGKKVAVK